MGQYNSSLTRVQPVFDALGERPVESWLPALWRMAVATKAGRAEPPPSLGSLRAGKTYERALPPSTAFLRWMVGNPERLTKPSAPHYGATPGGEAARKRADLFGPDTRLREAAITEALQEIDQKRGAGSAQKWWAFEGFTHVDASFETEQCLLLIEGKRTEAVSSSTRWFASRNQLWRNVEVAGELAGERPFGVILAVESEASGLAALAEAAASRVSSYPHLTTEQREALDRHLLGFVVWSEVVEKFGLPPSVLKETRDP